MMEPRAMDGVEQGAAMNTYFSTTRRALMLAALLAAAPWALAIDAPKAGDACFKRVFDKTASTGRWLVRECVKEADLFFQVDFRDPKLQQYAAMFKVAGDGMGSDSHNYIVLEGDTLAIDIMSERGGQVVLLHPLSGGTELSKLDIAYMNPDEGGKFNLKRSGNMIRLKTSVDEIAVAVDSEGRLRNVTKPVPQKK
jgi:hypothetical protein